MYEYKYGMILFAMQKIKISWSQGQKYYDVHPRMMTNKQKCISHSLEITRSIFHYSKLHMCHGHG